MRYAVSKEAVASGVIEPDQQLTEGTATIPSSANEGFSGESLYISFSVNKSFLYFVEEPTLSGIPTKSDGTADMRFTASQDAVASGEISCDQVLSGSGECSTLETAESSPGEQKSTSP